MTLGEKNKSHGRQETSGMRLCQQKQPANACAIITLHLCRKHVALQLWYRSYGPTAASSHTGSHPGPNQPWLTNPREDPPNCRPCAGQPSVELRNRTCQSRRAPSAAQQPGNTKQPISAAHLDSPSGTLPTVVPAPGPWWSCRDLVLACRDSTEQMLETAPAMTPRGTCQTT